MPNPLDSENASIRERLFGGNGAVHIWNCLGSQAAEPFKAVLWCALEPGGFVGRHRQEVFPEIVICVGGQGRAIVGETMHPLTEGALVFLPVGTSLSLHNDSKTEALNYIIIKAKSGE